MIRCRGSWAPLVTLRPATPEYQAHLIAYRDADEASSYHVAFEAALLLRAESR